MRIVDMVTIGFILAAIIAAFPANAGTYRLIDVERLDFEASEFRDRRDPYMPEFAEDQWTNRAALNFRLSLLESIYWDNRIHAETIETGQVKSVGWWWMLGLRVDSNIDLFAMHHSQHVLEEYRAPINGVVPYPVEDSYGIRFKFIDEKTGKSLVNWFD